MRRHVNFRLCLVICVLVPLFAFGWWDCSHTAITKAAGVSDNSLGQLPDIWDRQEHVIFIAPFFCWAHGVQSTGQSGWRLGLCPRKPSYPADDREPGGYMAMLERDKIKNPGPDAKKTALSFSYHNAADGVVHFSYFSGGSIMGWAVGHRVKEEWADYMIFTKKTGGAFNPCTSRPDPLDPQGPPLLEGGEPVVPFEVKCSGDAKIIQLAQQAYIKNRLSTKAGKNGVTHGLGTADSMEDIRQKILDYLREENTTYDHFSAYTFADLKHTAWVLRWSRNDCAGLWAKYESAITEVNAVR